MNTANGAPYIFILLALLTRAQLSDCTDPHEHLLWLLSADLLLSLLSSHVMMEGFFLTKCGLHHLFLVTPPLLRIITLYPSSIGYILIASYMPI